MRKLYFILILGFCKLAYADLSGVYVGGGLGYGIQSLTALGNSSTIGTPAIRAIVGYQFADWIGAEAGYTYITQANNWNNLGNPSVTVYDLAFTPGFTIPATPVSLYARLGIDAISANLNSNVFSQMFSSVTANFEWGAGVKVNIPATRVFIRAEYINFSSVANSNNRNISVTPSVIMLNAAYVFQ
jgi:hypothetical protein